MPDGDAFLSPEPIRFMYDSDEDHVRAWLAWAELTPGGWRARLADRGQVADDEIDQPDGAWTGRPNTRGAQGTRRLPVRQVPAPSPCCGREVLVDPEATATRLGLCSSCGTMLQHRGGRWERQAHSRGNE
ncbi:MAG TPA: hypothetical protein VGH66_00850 [Acidimicrobiales bacterium]